MPPKSSTITTHVQQYDRILLRQRRLVQRQQKILLERKKRESLEQQRAWVEIDHANLAHNVGQIRGLLVENKTALMAIVKADAYGHGGYKVAKTVLKAGATWLAVATVYEGKILRDKHIKARILLLGAANGVDEIKWIQEYSLEPTIVSFQQAQEFDRQLTETISVHLKIDTGMFRLGIPYKEAEEVCRQIINLKNINIVSIYSHLATAEDKDTTCLEKQKMAFEQVTRSLEPLFEKKPLFHLANCAGLMSNSQIHYDMVRPGLALYGVYPALHLQNKVDLKPVMNVKARITQVKTVPKGTGISYNHRFVTKEDITTVAVVSIGYADGVSRRLSNIDNDKTDRGKKQLFEVLLRGQRVPQIGCITMDQLMLDVTKVLGDPVAENEIVTLLGSSGEETISVDEWAEMLGTISWEILCGFKNRLPRVHLNEPI